MLHRYLFQRSIVGTCPATHVTAASDLSFVVRKFKNYSTDEYSTIDSDGMSVPPLACAFAKMHQWQHVVGIVDEDGYLVLYNSCKTGKEAVIKTWQVHANAVFDLEWLQEENKILTASGDQKILLHDIETSEKLDIFKGHNSSVKSISCRKGDDAVFVSGSRDGHIMMWDKRISSKDGAIPPISIISNAHMLQKNVRTAKTRKNSFYKDAQQSVTAVLFQNDYYVISAGAVDGCLKVWDVRKNYRSKLCKPVHTFHYPGNNARRHGYSNLVQTSNGLHLFANCTDDVIYEYDMAAYNPLPVRMWRGHKNSTFYVKSALSPDDQYLLSGSSDEFAYIWQINKPHKSPIVLKSHTAEVTSVAWCPNDMTKLVTLSDDSKAKFWRVCCREREKKFHPQWFGKAEQISKERATSTTTSDVPQASTPFTPPASPSFQKLLPNKSKITCSPNGLSDVLKRKPQPDCADSLACKKSRLENVASPDGRKQLLEESDLDFNSPTKDLPNLILDQLAGRNATPPRPKVCQSPKLDWLTKLRLQNEKRKSQSNCDTEGLAMCKKSRIDNADSNHVSQASSSFTPPASPTFQKLQQHISNSTCSPNGSSDMLKRKSDSDECDLSASKRLRPENVESPQGRKLSLDLDFASPTKDLPNLVLEQLAGKNVTPPRAMTCQSPKLDWLTQLRLQKLKSETTKSPVNTSCGKIFQKCRRSLK